MKSVLPAELDDKVGGGHTSLGNAQSVDSCIRPALAARNTLVPVELDGSALGENGNGIHHAGDGIESDEGPEEPLPALALNAK